ncbi:MAG: hypothetical protein Q7R79_00505 [bacterium]|nr:hypothetical protein [bacterium]
MDPMIIGLVGAALILLAFVLGQLHVWKDTYLAYDLLNAAGSILLVVYGWMGSAWPFVILNSVWAIVSLRDVAVDLSRNARKTSALGSWHKWME